MHCLFIAAAAVDTLRSEMVLGRPDWRLSLPGILVPHMWSAMSFRARRIQVLMDVGQELLLVAASILMQWDRLKHCRAYCWEIAAEICSEGYALMVGVWRFFSAVGAHSQDVEFLSAYVLGLLHGVGTVSF